MVKAVQPKVLFQNLKSIVIIVRTANLGKFSMRTRNTMFNDFFLKIKFIYLCTPIARSSNGRTSDFDSDCIGSNPVRATNEKPRKCVAFFMTKTNQSLLCVCLRNKKSSPTKEGGAFCLLSPPFLGSMKLILILF